MTERKELGFIQKCSFGWGGYQDAMMGLSITLGGQSWGVGDFKGGWGSTRTEHCKWTEDDRLRDLGGAVMFLKGLLEKAGKQSVEQLVGTPIEATFEGNTLKSWRVLEEVLPRRNVA
jgi:hypothetical protein